MNSRIAAALARVTATATALLDVFRGEAGMSRQDRARWATANSLADVADLTACWIAGDIASQPGYIGPSDLDERYAPGMTDALIQLNRTGVVLTTSSQAGHLSGAGTKDLWVLHAAISGFIRADLAELLRRRMTARGMTFVWCHRRRGFEPIAPVTLHNDRCNTDFGNALPKRGIADEWVGYGLCQPGAVRALQQAVQFAVYDPQPNRNTELWSALTDAARELVDFRITDPS